MEAKWSLLLAAFVPMAVLLLAALLDQRRRRLTEKPPQEEKLLRPAGYSLAIRLEETQDTILTDFLWASGLCGLAGVLVAFTATLLARHGPALWTTVATLLFAGCAVPGAWVAVVAFRRLREVRNLRLGLRGEQAVAEVLHEIGDCGFRAFHDLPGGENWNIDHVAVGPGGVFLIETKARRRRASRSQQPNHVVVYDGKALKFPSGDDTRAIAQAQRNAGWLAEFLAKMTAEPVTVEPVVVVPGWYVETKGAFPVKVMNATYLARYLRGQSEKLAPAQARRIIAALDEKCRDVEF